MTVTTSDQPMGDPGRELSWRDPRRVRQLGTALTAVLLVAGCSRSPSQNILGSFFPSWLLCLGLGLLAAVGSRVAMGWLGFRDEVPVPLLTYLSVAFAVTCLLWLVWFGH